MLRHSHRTLFVVLHGSKYWGTMGLRTSTVSVGYVLVSATADQHYVTGKDIADLMLAIASKCPCRRVSAEGQVEPFARPIWLFSQVWPLALASLRHRRR